MLDVARATQATLAQQGRRVVVRGVVVVVEHWGVVSDEWTQEDSSPLFNILVYRVFCHRSNTNRLSTPQARAMTGRPLRVAIVLHRFCLLTNVIIIHVRQQRVFGISAEDRTLRMTKTKKEESGISRNGNA